MSSLEPRYVRIRDQVHRRGAAYARRNPAPAKTAQFDGNPVPRRSSNFAGTLGVIGTASLVTPVVRSHGSEVARTRRIQRSAEWRAERAHREHLRRSRGDCQRAGFRVMRRACCSACEGCTQDNSDPLT
ncbi:hypothetical protein VTO73DRAFT_13399 [Trametes versicolor]